MSIDESTTFDGVPHVGTLASSGAQTLTVELDYWADTLQIYADVACTLKYASAAGAAFEIPIPAGAWTSFYGRFPAFYVDTTETTSVSWHASRTRLPVVSGEVLTGEGVTSHASASFA